jgi:hypothetical protein
MKHWNMRKKKYPREPILRKYPMSYDIFFVVETTTYDLKIGES